MISAESAIRALRRDLTVASLLKGLLVGGALMCIVAGPVLGSRLPLSLTIVAIGAIWLILSYRSAKGSSLAADSPLARYGRASGPARHLMPAAQRGSRCAHRCQPMTVSPGSRSTGRGGACI